MSKPIAIEFSADTKDVIRGAGDIADSFDDVADSLKDVARDSAKSSDKMEDGAKDVSKALDRTGDSAKELESKLDRAFKSVSDDARKASKSIDEDTKRGFKGAAEGAENFKEEANSTAKESAASFDGSAESIIGSFQEVAANAFAGFGPAGAAAGLLAAAGLGIAQAALQGNADKANELGEAVTELATEIRAADGDLAKINFDEKMQDWGLSIQDTKEWWELFQDSAKTGLDTIREKSTKAGVGWVEAFRGTKGTMEDSQAALEKVDRLLQEATDSAKTYQDLTGKGMARVDPADQAKIDALTELKKGYQENITTQERAVEANRLLEAAGVKTEDQLQREEDALEAVNEELTRHASKLAEAAGAAVSADRAELSWAETLKSSTEDIASNGKTLDINTEAGRANRQTLLEMADSANTLVQAQIDQGASTAEVTAKSDAARAAFVAAAEAAGYGSAEAQALADKYGLVPKDVETRVKAHGVEEARKWPDTIPPSKDVSVNVAVGKDHVSPYIDTLQGKRVFVDFAPRGGVAVTN